MDPVTLIVAALTAGASAGVGDTVSQAIKDAYGALKSVVRKRLRDRPDGELVLDRHEQEPDTWQEPLRSELESSGVSNDDEVVALARRLIELVEAEGGAAGGKYRVDASSSQGVQIGDHGTQRNEFTQRGVPDQA